MPNLNVFEGSGFRTQELTHAFNTRPHHPMRIGQMNLFAEKGIRTTSVQVESKAGRLSLIASSPRGSNPIDPVGPQTRTLRTFQTFHFERNAKVYAEEIQDVRAFGSETELESLMSVVNERMDELRPMHEVTLEYNRINAIQGLLLEANGSTATNLFTEFGVTQLTQNFAFTTTDTDVVGAFTAAKRKAEGVLGGEVITGWRVISSAEWFDAFRSHANVKESFVNMEGAVLRQDLRDGVRYAGCDVEEYRGSVARPDSIGGTAAFIPADVAFLVPITADPIFITRFAPADYEETVNTVGLPLYAKMAPDPSGLNKYRLINTQSNPICLCTRPSAVIKLTKS